jgi:hypothetical protein
MLREPTRWIFVRQAEVHVDMQSIYDRVNDEMQTIWASNSDQTHSLQHLGQPPSKWVCSAVVTLETKTLGI